ncbi:Lrp/AsnC family transcriptional regulator [Staphylococcus gallinarum]|uniref:Lrp/AsnC family transcriptional regulator n=1 Tax=Staphylococcus gallinarum TaxID=1293 RepID=A0A3A0VKR4_STAGA|nr:Lrp/AsnC family transcriptional regulator [Staphylococcus gallinarum]RIP33460.1 Lrp/AsnC family transcriptional regulator [Staphylococcus gallinarum]
MDLTDEKILQILKHDSKVSLNKISNDVNLSTPSVRERIIKLKELGIIDKYTIDINYSLLGFNIEVFIDLLIKNNLYNDFKKFISEQSNVEFCYRISGESFFLFKARFRAMEDVETFIDQLQHFGHTKSHFVFSKIV